MVAEIFGIALAPLFFAISQVESDRGATSDNVYQIRAVYVDDVNRIVGRELYTYDDVHDIGKSEEMMVIYWRYYCEIYKRHTGKPVTYEVLARMHNGGPKWYKKEATVSYCGKVLKELDEYNMKTNK